MSRGPGKIQRAIKAIIEAEPDRAFLLSELCERVYPGINRVEKKHRVAVARAAARMPLPTISWMKCDRLGGELVYFTPFNVRSYAMANIISDTFEEYRNNDGRLLDWKKERRSDFDRVAAKVESGGEKYSWVVEGGAWWLHVQMAIAEHEADQASDKKNKLEALTRWHAHQCRLYRSVGLQPRPEPEELRLLRAEVSAAASHEPDNPNPTET
jgi:hypothetical protein